MQSRHPQDALLVAIREDYVDGTEFLLKHEEDSHQAGQPYTWESMDPRTANFTADMTPLILASHRSGKTCSHEVFVFVRMKCSCLFA